MTSTTADDVSLGSALQPAIRALVTEALSRGLGATMSTNAEFQQQFGIGAGTIQRALAVLRDRGALELTSRGHLGRIVASINVGPAWRLAGLAPVRMLLPPGGAAEVDVLEEVLAENLTELGIPHTVHHLRGGARRVNAIEQGTHDLALVSAGVHRQHRTESRKSEDELTRVLSPGTYYAANRLVVVQRTDRADERPQTIAIDHRSSDHVLLTRHEFPKEAGYTYVGTPFTSVPATILRRTADAGIWHMTRSVIPLDLAGLTLRPLQVPEALAGAEALSAAALVGWAGRPELRTVLQELRLGELEARQEQAIEAESLEEYDI